MNQPQIDIDQIMRNTRRYWYVDGINEIAGGGLIFFIALTYFLFSLIPNIGMRSILLGLVQPLVIIGGSIFTSKIVKIIKEKLTYPRTGYLLFRQQKSRRVRRMVIVFLTAFMISILVSFFASAIPEQFTPLMTGIFMAGFTIYIAYWMGVNRFYWMSGFTLIIGVVITLLNLPGVLPFVTLFAGIGLIWMISGSWTLINYLKNTEPVEEGA